MSLLVVGSVAFDTVQTPFGRAERVLGGSASYFSFAASFFTEVRLVSIVGGDFPSAWLELFVSRGIDLSGLERGAGKTFFWAGRYLGEAMEERETTSVELNVFGNYVPKLPAKLCESEFVFLANGSPRMQNRVRDQLKCPSLVVCDTMDHWIRDEKEDLLRVLTRADGAVFNESEMVMLTGKQDLAEAADDLLNMGLRFCIVKKGAEGSFLAYQDQSFNLPACGEAKVVDPTGAGDSFAGALMGHLAAAGKIDFDTLKNAMAYGTALASFTIEDFSLEGLTRTRCWDLNARYQALKEAAHF